jgi:16S rRNA (cytosine967-C5)-methyltransferase
MIDKARTIAAAVLKDMEEEGAYSNLKLNQYFKSYGLEHINRNFASEILYGTLRNKLKIDYMISKFSKITLDKMSPWTRNIIRTAVYQIFYMDRVPEFAAVNEAVEIAKAKDRKAASFVNGVLRGILRNKEDYNKIDVKDHIRKMSIEYSHPEWFIKKYLPIFGEEFLCRWMEKNNTPSHMTVRVNTLKTDTEDAARLFEEKGIGVKRGILPEALILEGYGMIEKSDEYNSGLITIQDESSMLASRVLCPAPDSRVLDMCSAPGGKATHMAQLMRNSGEVRAFDLYPHKIKLIRENALRMGLHIIKAQEGDAAKHNQELESYADFLLLDAPCSGLGLMRKKPEIRWRVTEEDIMNLQKVQKDILSNVSGYVKPGGHMVYSTCTITREENEDVLDYFLKTNSEFFIDDIHSYIPEELKDSITPEGFLKLFPQDHNTDGFFIARLRRKK